MILSSPSFRSSGLYASIALLSCSTLCSAAPPHHGAFGITHAHSSSHARTLTTRGESGPVQLPGLQRAPGSEDDANTVVNLFSEAFNTYKKFAFGHDDLQPVSETFNDGRNGWGASIVDGMPTMFIMGLDDLFNEAVNFSANIDFSMSQVDETVSVFESTIRYVAGLLSSYQLSGSQHQVLVDKAQELADKLAFAWVGNNDIPFGEMNFTTNEPIVAEANIAEAGTLTLEWSILSRLTGNDTYRNLTEKAVRHIASLDDPFPGLAPQCIDADSGQFTCELVTWGGGSDSYLEYLVKYPLLTGTTDPTFIDEWRLAVDSSIKELLRISTVGDHTYLADWDGQIEHVGSHLACFHGGNWILGGQLLRNETITSIGLDLVEACWNTYASTATGIGPEVFAFISSDGNFTGSGGPDQAQLEFYQEHGFYILSGDYVLRPEVLESNFYAWRATGDVKYVERARAATKSLEKSTMVNGAFAGINNVNAADGGGFIDDEESFLFAEVLKYLFLTFDDPDHISLDKFVFNTEAQPFLIEAGGLGTLGSPSLPFLPSFSQGPASGFATPTRSAGVPFAKVSAGPSGANVPGPSGSGVAVAGVTVAV